MSGMFASKFEILLVDVSNSKSKMSLSKVGHSDEALNDDIPGDLLVSLGTEFEEESLQHASLTFRIVDRKRSDRFRSTFCLDKRCWYGESELESKVASEDEQSYSLVAFWFKIS